MPEEKEFKDDNPYKDDASARQAAIQMDKISRTLFAPVYPLIAEQIKDKFNMTAGTCIDMGAGSASLSIALANITRMEIHAMDASMYSFEFAERNIREQGLESRITPVMGKAEKMPFENNFADLIISRGSVFFWEDLPGAFKEIFRVLKPGGGTWIGGGFGSPALKKKIFEEMAKKDDRFAQKAKHRFSPENIERITNAIEESGVRTYDIDKSDKGLWINITKENRQ